MIDLSKKKAVFHPLPGRIAVEPLEEESSGGIILLPGQREKPVLGTIVEISEDTEGLMVSLGDLVLFGANAGMLVEIGRGAAKRKVIFLRESEIISKVTWENLEQEAVQAAELTPHEFVCPNCEREGHQIVDRNRFVRKCIACGSEFPL